MFFDFVVAFLVDKGKYIILSLSYILDNTVLI